MYVCMCVCRGREPGPGADRPESGPGQGTPLILAIINNS